VGEIRDIRNLLIKNNGHRTAATETGKIRTISNHTMVQKSSGRTEIIIIITEVLIRVIKNTRKNLKTIINKMANMLIILII